MEETQLIKECQRGKPKAQRLLFDTYYTYVYSTCLRYLANHHDTEDVVSVVFNKIFLNIDSFKGGLENGLKRWIKTISINEALRFIKRKRPVVYTEELEHIEFAEYKEDDFDPSFDIKKVKNCIEKMPEGYRTVFMLNTVDGLSHSEIAAHLGISRNTSKSQMLKARKYLIKELRKNESSKY